MAFCLQLLVVVVFMKVDHPIEAIQSIITIREEDFIFYYPFSVFTTEEALLVLIITIKVVFFIREFLFFMLFLHLFIVVAIFIIVIYQVMAFMEVVIESWGQVFKCLFIIIEPKPKVGAFKLVACLILGVEWVLLP